MMANQDYTTDFLTAKRQLGDSPVDLFIHEVFKDPELKRELQQWLACTTSKDQLGDLQKEFPAVAFISEAGQLPVWADKQLLKEGSDFFIRHSETIMTLLGLLSLPYCYAAANGAMVLYLSERMRKDATKRLYETAVFVWEVMAPGAFDTKGKGFTEILKVRLLHAAIRYYTLNSGKWDDSWGVPINQEDMAGTNLSFSLIVIRGLRKMGYTVSYNDQIAFMHLWNVIGYLSGLQEELIPENSKIAQTLDHAISQRQFRPSSHGKELATSLTAHIISVNKSKATANDIMGLMRFLLGNDIADMISVNAPELPGYKLRLIKTINLFKSLKPQGNTAFVYHRAYAAFKSLKEV